MFGKLFACFILMKFNLYVVVIDVRGFEVRKFYRTTFSFFQNYASRNFLFVYFLTTDANVQNR